MSEVEFGRAKLSSETNPTLADVTSPEYFDRVRAEAVESVRVEREYLRSHPDVARVRREGVERAIARDQELHRKYYPEQYEMSESPTNERHFWPAWIRKAFKR